MYDLGKVLRKRLPRYTSTSTLPRTQELEVQSRVKRLCVFSVES